MGEPYGATPAEWDHFSLLLGLTEDLLPVVANPDAEISPQSKMRSLGKTPSRYNSHGQVAGIANWTQKKATSAEVAAWREVSDLGICIQTRHVRALDCDIDGNNVFAKDVHDAINNALAQALPCRRRANSSKFLLAFTLEGEYAKRTIRTDHGIIEFLATGQQFVAAGAHNSGARIEWEGGLPDDIPILTPEQFEALWTKLTEAFASDGTADVAVPTIRHTKIKEAAQNDPVALSLIDSGVVVSTERDGRLHIVCPFESEHTAGGDASATTYFPAFTGGYERGHFHCLHAHCAQKSDGDFLAALGLSSGSDAGEFAVEVPTTADDANVENAPKLKYTFQPWQDFINAKPPTFHIKGVLPEAALAVVYGAPGSGKTFLVMDMGFAVAQGIPWRGLKVKQGTVAYIAAEDAHGVRMRAKAYADEHKIDNMPFYILGAAPNFRDFDDMTQVAKAVVALGDVSLIFVDTWARALAGGDENSAKDVGEAVTLCAKLYRATGATVVLVHHSGKDSTKGARGSTALLGACDAEIEVSREGVYREAQVTKLKNAADGQRFAFKLRTVPVGLDDDNEVITSCVLEHAAVEAKRAKLDNGKGDYERAVLAVIDELGSEGGIDLDSLLERAKEQLVHDPQKRDKRREHCTRAVGSLKHRNVIEQDEKTQLIRRTGAGDDSQKITS